MKRIRRTLDRLFISVFTLPFFVLSIVFASELPRDPIGLAKVPIIEEVDQGIRAVEIIEGPMVSYSFVDVLKGCCALAYTPLIKLEELQEADDIGLFFREEGRSEKSFAGLTKKIGDALIVAFPGTRTGHSVGSLISDVKADAKGMGKDEGFVQSLGLSEFATSKIVAYPGFASEVIMFYRKMFQQIEKYTGIREIYFTGHSKGGGVSILSALKYALDPQNHFTKNAIKVFTFATPPVLNTAGLHLFHRTIGEYNAVCIYKNADIVPYSAMFFKFFSWFGKDTGYHHVGIQANISKHTDKVSDFSTEVQGMVAECTANGWAVSVIAQNLLKVALAAHSLDDFSCEAIREVMQRMRGNYGVNPYMDRNKIGRDERPLFAFWK